MAELGQDHPAVLRAGVPRAVALAVVPLRSPPARRTTGSVERSWTLRAPHSRTWGAEPGWSVDLADTDRPEPPAQRPEDELTTRELSIVSLIALGLSNDEIARRSYLSVNSIKTYIRSAYRKMAVTTRPQAVLWAVDHGLRPARSPDHGA